MYKAITVARYIIERCNQTNQIISNLKLQKILYFVQAEFLVSTEQVCFPDRIEAWDFGPVVPSVYHHYKAYGGGNIPEAKRFFPQTIIKTNDRPLIDRIVDECAKYSASALVEITHRQTPWKSAYQPRCNNEISPESIQAFFTEG